MRGSFLGLMMQISKRAFYFKLALVLMTGSIAGNTQASTCAEVFSQRPSDVQDSRSARVIVFSAPSGGGKTTLAGLLAKDFPKLDISISTTTRAPRGTEKDGVDYHFLSVDDFKAKIAQGKFAEWAEVHGNYYGSNIENIQKSLDNGHSVLVLIDTEGARSFRKLMPEKVFTIFIAPPDMKTLEARLRDRGTDPEDAIQQRLKNAQAEMAASSSFDKVIVNDRLEYARRELKALFTSFHLVPNSN